MRGTWIGAFIVGVCLGLWAGIMVTSPDETKVVQCVDASSSAGTVMCLQPNNDLVVIPAGASEAVTIDMLRREE